MNKLRLVLTIPLLAAVLGCTSGGREVIDAPEIEKDPAGIEVEKPDLLRGCRCVCNDPACVDLLCTCNPDELIQWTPVPEDYAHERCEGFGCAMWTGARE